MSLTGQQKRYLRGLAHHHQAIVQVGHQGVTEGVLKQLSAALEDHELVKVRLAQAVDDRAGAAEELASGTGSDCVQTMGRTAVFYRARKEKPEIVLPGTSAAKAAAKAPATKKKKKAPGNSNRRNAARAPREPVEESDDAVDLGDIPEDEGF
jgi:RNA-binding protein